jgi:hypothetical protein
MKELEYQLRRLLRAAAAAPPARDREPGIVPSARWLMRQREQPERVIPVAVQPVLQGGLAVVCVLLLVSSLINMRQIEKANEEVFAVPEAVLTRLVTP